MAEGIVVFVDENMVGNRVNTFKYGFGVMSGKCESIGGYRRYEVILDDPDRWPCSSQTDSGPFFALKELQFA